MKQLKKWILEIRIVIHDVNKSILMINFSYILSIHPFFGSINMGLYLYYYYPLARVTRV